MTLGCTAALTACGGGGSGDSGAEQSAATPASAPVATPTKRTTALPLIVLLRGDSTNYGSHPGENTGSVPNQTPNNPAALMQTDFDILFGPGVVKVVNAAEPGSTIEDDLYGTGPYTAGPLQAVLPGTGASVVVTNAELNDASYGVDPSLYQTYLETWVRTVQTAGMVPVIEEPNPTCIAPIGSNGARTIDAAYIDVQHTVSLQFNTTVLPVYNAFVAQSNWQSLLQADCEHPTDAGYEFKEGQYMTNLYPIVKAMLGR
ncbi:SGNH/GDSL hydrolase family protein [Paraburkholderia sediminicola]|uniref:SGNH/GDSL hydrolase family protein n=1 Tax=Paraburkholderia sediminicola TaxID=458836 RepID=UPI0038B99CF5